MPDDGLLGFVPVPGGRLYFERVGRGPGLVLIHSAFLDSRMWDPQMGALSGAHTLVRYDMRGHGRSTGERAGASDAEDLVALLNHLDLANVFLLGNSDGARVACDFAAGLPDRVRGLILVAGTPHDLEPTDEEKARFMATFPEGERRLTEEAQAGHRTVALELILDIWAPRVPPAERARLRAIAEENYDHFVEFLNQDGPAGLRPAYPVAASIQKGLFPLLSIAGAHDHPVLEMMMGRFAATNPRAHHVVLAEGDHTPSLSATSEFDRVVLDFLSSVEGSRPWPPPRD